MTSRSPSRIQCPEKHMSALADHMVCKTQGGEVVETVAPNVAPGEGLEEAYDEIFSVASGLIGI